MFQRRLTVLWIMLTVLALTIVARLAQIQVAQAGAYADLAKRILTRPVRYVPAPRGDVTDRHGVVLASDEPTSEVAIHYGALVASDDYLYGVARQLRQRGDYPANARLHDITDTLHTNLRYTWERLAELTGTSRAELEARVGAACARVDRVRAAVQRSNPTIRRVAEEDEYLSILEGVPSAVAVSVRLELERFPWLRVVPASRRVTHDAVPLAHLLGRLGPASEERIADDPLAGVELRRLRPGERCGLSGVERLAETSLRGWAGRVVEDFERREIERTDPVAGHDVQLTIDVELQRRVFGWLAEAVQDGPTPSGAAAVVMDVATREVLALVSYPTYNPATFSADYPWLRRDTRDLPLSFRAVQAQYPPGSICKAVTLVGGLTTGVVTPETRFHCTGHLLPDQPDAFRCWIYRQNHGVTHDMTDDPAGQNGESAVRNSCNIYFFNVGGLLGPERLCEWFSRFGLGRTQGTGFIEEADGIVPNAAWMQRVQGREHRKSDAWNFSIGQGEVTVTPLQAANVAATIATGVWMPVHLVYDDTGQALGEPPVPPVKFDDAALTVLRRGMWRVVNERGGTAPAAKMDSKAFELCGKTGSAQAEPRVVTRRFTLEWPDGRREEMVAPSEEEVLAPYGDAPPKIVGWRTAERYPQLNEGDSLPAHAWFIGYTQRTGTRRGAAPTGDHVYALSVLIEYAGSGGRIAGPVARRIAEYLTEGKTAE